MNDLAPFMVHDDQHVEQSKGRGGNHKEIHRRHTARMVLKKRSPSLRRLAPGLGPIFPDGCRGSLQSQFGQFVANARAAPSRVESPHPADELDQFAGERMALRKARWEYACLFQDRGDNHLVLCLI